MNHRVHAGKLLGGRDVDRHDARVSVRAAQDRPDEQPRDPQIVGVHRRPRHLLRRVDLGPDPDHVIHLICKHPL
jgi:hypothetical protein